MPNRQAQHQDKLVDSSQLAEETTKPSFVESPLPRLPGIYQICCVPTGKIYIGSAKNLRVRWGQHRRSLRSGTHGNLHLQRAWEKHGEANFEITILELVELSDLLASEQAWIDRTGCADREVGYNIFNVAGSPGAAFARIWEGFVDPDGNDVTITNLYEFCRIHNLDFPSMHRLAMGKSKLKSYKGWTHKNSPRKRDYVKTYEGFISPAGLPVGPITNLAAFCREHGLDNTHMVAVARGRLYSHRGWTYANERQNLGLPKAHAGFINPEGQQVVITNLTAFCHEHGLSVVHMHGLKSGKRRSHKGWTWRDPHE
ncbi:MAG: GIY-YIG nuclease family protein [Chloroflexia bacterium]